MAGISPTEFHKFGELPLELRLLIWEEAIRMDHHNRIVPITNDTKTVIIMNSGLGAPSGVLRASPESRAAGMGVYDLALPVQPFYPVSSWGLSPAQNQMNAVYPFGFVQQGVVRVSLRLDIFLVSCDIVDFLREKMSQYEYANLVTRLTTFVPPSQRLNKAPRHMTTSLTNAMCARIERILEVRSVSAWHPNIRATHASQVAHSYDATQYPGVRECFHVDNPISMGGIRTPSRLLCHLSQGTYSSDRLLTWLHPWVCRF